MLKREELINKRNEINKALAETIHSMKSLNELSLKQEGAIIALNEMIKDYDNSLQQAVATVDVAPAITADRTTDVWQSTFDHIGASDTNDPPTGSRPSTGSRPPTQRSKKCQN